MVRPVVAAVAVVMNAIVAAPPVVPSDVIAVRPVLADVVFVTDMVGRIVAAAASLGDSRRGDRSHSGERQQNLRDARSHSVLPFLMGE
jgi:hypothetical protein